ncbi:MAG: ArdC family protein [Burkholderiaceae bacterium]|jgi:antirestriction protein ArdC|nr:ArdC family protein [Burkholderiaceae bacterium]
MRPPRRRPPEISDAVKEARIGLAERLVRQAAQGVAPWDKTVDPSRGERLPYTPFSKSETHDALRGVNGIQLASAAQEKGYRAPRWISSSQLQNLGWRSRAGETGVNVEFYNAAGTERLQYKRDEQGNEVYDDDGKRVSEKVVLLKSTVGPVHMYNMEQVVEGKYAKPPIPKLEEQVTPREPAFKEFSQAFAKSGIEVQDAVEGAPSHVSAKGKGSIYLAQNDRNNEVAKAQLMVRAMAAKALNLDTAGGWSHADSDRTKNIKTQLRVEMAARILSDQYAVPAKPGQLTQLKEHVAQVLNTVNEKTGERDQIRFAARDADRAITRVLEGNWTRSQEQQRGQQQGHPQEQQQPERSEQRQEQPEPPPQAKAPAKSHKRSRALERA